MKVLIETVESFGNRLSKIEEWHVAAQNDAIVRTLSAGGGGILGPALGHPRGGIFGSALGKGSSASSN